MKINDDVLQKSEKILFELRELYFSRGYEMFRMSKFEEYDLYARNKDFLVSDNVITFTDMSGKLMALKPDVTLSIIKNSADEPGRTRKLFYNENVYRASGNDDSFREIMQAGVECFGSVGVPEVCENLQMAAESLKLLSEESVLAVSDLSILEELIEKMDVSGSIRRKLYNAISERNLQEIEALCAKTSDDADGTNASETIVGLLETKGTIEDVIPALDSLLGSVAAYASFRLVMEDLARNCPKAAETVRIDFSVLDDFNYYNDIVFKGFIPGIPRAVLSGGQYDRLMKKAGRRSRAIGFAVYMDALERLEISDTPVSAASDGFINVALPKGRLGSKVYSMFADAGYPCSEIMKENRRLIFENDEAGVRYFWVKPSDVAIYVERGAADIGVVGKDILLEYEPDVYELMDLGEGKCRMCVAAPKDFRDSTDRTLRVATKFSNIARNYYRRNGRDIDIIHLNGSIEVAPILGLSDVIVDLVETGTTLKENDLAVFAEVCPISARLIANKSSYKFKSGAVDEIRKAFEKLISEEDR